MVPGRCRRFARRSRRRSRISSSSLVDQTVAAHRQGDRGPWQGCATTLQARAPESGHAERSLSRRSSRRSRSTSSDRGATLMDDLDTHDHESDDPAAGAGAGPGVLRRGRLRDRLGDLPGAGERGARCAVHRRDHPGLDHRRALQRGGRPDAGRAWCHDAARRRTLCLPSRRVWPDAGLSLRLDRVHGGRGPVRWRRWPRRSPATSSSSSRRRRASTARSGRPARPCSPSRSSPMVNILGTRRGGTLQVVGTVLKVGGVAALMLLPFLHSARKPEQPQPVLAVDAWTARSSPA